MADRRAALDMAMRQIEKQFGKGSIMKLGESTHMQVEVVPSGSLALDIALGIGGSREDVLLKYMDQNLLVKRPLRFMRLQKFNVQVDKLPLSMQSMHLIRYMQAS